MAMACEDRILVDGCSVCTWQLQIIDKGVSDALVAMKGEYLDLNIREGSASWGRRFEEPTKLSRASTSAHLRRGSLKTSTAPYQYKTAAKSS
jgi:hypothetical protein